MSDDLPFIFWTEKDVDEVKNVIEKLINMSDLEIFSLGSLARRYAEDVVSWSSKSRLLIEFYKTFQK